MKSVIVFGATGMAGHMITLYLLNSGYDVTAFARRNLSFCKTEVGDALNADRVREVLQQRNYDVVINCIGLLNMVAEDRKAEAVFLNSYLPHLIAKTVRDNNSKVIHLSTDCVFTGNSGPYFEHSFQDGKSFYDRTKAMGELNYGRTLTFRNSIIGPDMNTNGIGLFNWFMKQNGKIRGYSGAMWNGVTTLTLAKAIDKAIVSDLTGVYHLLGNEPISKFELLNLFNKSFRNGKLEIVEDDLIKLDKCLTNTRSDFKFTVGSYSEMINEMKDWVDRYDRIYNY